MISRSFFIGQVWVLKLKYGSNCQIALPFDKSCHQKLKEAPDFQIKPVNYGFCLLIKYYRSSLILANKIQPISFWLFSELTTFLIAVFFELKQLHLIQFFPFCFNPNASKPPVCFFYCIRNIVFQGLL